MGSSISRRLLPGDPNAMPIGRLPVFWKFVYSVRRSHFVDGVYAAAPFTTFHIVRMGDRNGAVRFHVPVSGRGVGRTKTPGLCSLPSERALVLNVCGMRSHRACTSYRPGLLPLSLTV